MQTKMKVYSKLKKQKNDKTGWVGTQTLITPKGRETFRLLIKGSVERNIV
ncbi:MAG: hypothetical protein KatS3mg079_456 [Caloramator sp.]|nr:MAG: hypothetical protein KatS3mg079_456 [Caloramator sp.]